METKHIIYKNFNNKNKQLNKKKLSNFLKFKILIEKYPSLKSLINNYNYSFQKKNLLKFKKYDEFNLIGMGGSILGAQAIYDFLSHKIKKKFFFYNNLQNISITKSNKKRLNIIISKSGNTLETLSNLNLILSKQKRNKNLIITEKKNNILRAMANKLRSDVIDHKNYNDREEYDGLINSYLENLNPDLIVLAGYMRIMSKSLVDNWEGQIVNIHPSLLPKYPGLNTHKRALEAKDKTHGSTIHFVTSELDSGPIIRQESFEIEPSDTEESLINKVKDLEHKIYPETISLLIK